MMEKLTGRKKQVAQRGYCPDCEIRMIQGPCGGLCVNMKCPACKAEFNVGPVTVERICPDSAIHVGVDPALAGAEKSVLVESGHEYGGAE